MKVINDIISNLDVVKNEYLNLINNSKMKIKQNDNQIEVLNQKIIDIEIAIKKYVEELDIFNQNYKKFGEHINGIESSNYNYSLLDANQINQMKSDSLQKKENITTAINNKIEKAKKGLALAKEKMNILISQNKSIKELLPALKTNYDNTIINFEKALEKLNNEIIIYNTNLIEKLSELNKEIEINKVEIKEEPKLKKEETKKLDKAIESKPEINKEETPQIEEIKDNLIIEKESELNKEQIIDKKSSEKDKQISTPILDYRINEYIGIEEMNLTDSQITKLINNMSSDKFIQITTILKKYNIPLSDISPFYNEFINIEDVENLEETFNILKGLGKNNNDKDFSLMLDTIFGSDNLILQDNLLTIYSKGKNPKDESIYKLTSPLFSDFDEQAQLLEVDGKDILKKYPISSMLIPITKLVDFNKLKNPKDNIESIKKVA